MGITRPANPIARLPAALPLIKLASRILFFFLLPFLAGECCAVTGPLDDIHKPLERFLKGYVRYENRFGVRGRYVRTSIKYGQLRKNAEWDEYVAGLAYIDASTLKTSSRASRMAFWINTYNVLAIHSVAKNYPLAGGLAEYPPGSLRGSPAWDQVQYVAGGEITLESIHSTLLKMEEPRALLAVSQAAVSSPPVMRVYTARNLESQLDDAAENYFRDPVNLSVDQVRREIRLSDLMKTLSPMIKNNTYTIPQQVASFPSEHRALVAYLSRYFTAEQKEYVFAKRPVLRFGVFDWSLNEAK